MILILVSFETKEDAEKMAHLLVDKNLAACVSLMPVTSVYHWKGEKKTASEFEGIIKTTPDKFDLIEKEIKNVLGYEIPQLIQVNVEKANNDYFRWVEEKLYHE